MAHYRSSEEENDVTCNETTEVVFPDGSCTSVRFRGVPEGLIVGALLLGACISLWCDTKLLGACIYIGCNTTPPNRIAVPQEQQRGRKRNASQIIEQVQHALGL